VESGFDNYNEVKDNLDQASSFEFEADPKNKSSKLSKPDSNVFFKI